MSSDYLSSVQGLDLARMQESARVSRAAAADQTSGRNEPAAGGENVPLQAATNAGDPAQVQSAVSQISDFVQNFQRDLQFSVDQDSGRTVIKVVDSETQEVIRQIPPEDLLRMARNLGSPDSLIIKEQA